MSVKRWTGILMIKILVTGMHRSGTSMTANILHDSGFTCSTSMRADIWNGKGYFEDTTIMVKNDQIIDGQWDNPISINENRFSLVNYEFDVIKDPRFCLTLGNWDLPDDLKIICCNRNNMSVAESLKAREGKDIDYWLKLKTTYHKHLTANIRGYDYLWVQYEELLEGIDTISDFIGREANLSCIDKQLKRH